jgi:hypothetical protein
MNHHKDGPGDPGLHPADHKFLEDVRRELDRGAAELDAVTVAKLRAMRMRAFEEAARPRRLPWWQPAGAVALLAVVASSGWLLSSRIETTPAEPPQEMLASELGHDAYDTPEFYEWVDAQYDGNDPVGVDDI